MSFISKSNQSCFNYRNLLKSESGFTLLEVLAVLFIIGIIVSFAGLSVGQRTSRASQEEAERFYNLVRIAGEEAVMQGRELAIEFTQRDYRFLELGSDNLWAPLEEDVLYRKREIPQEMNIELFVEGAIVNFGDEKNLPRIFVLSSGELTDFKLSFSLDDDKIYTVTSSIDGKVNLSQPGSNDT